MENHSQITKLSECFIKPEIKATTNDNSEPHYLAKDDLIMLSTHYMQKGLLFSKPSTFTTNELSCLLNKLKLSLSLSLVHFYPLAGRLATRRYEDEHSCSIYIDFDKGSGAKFIHAKANVTSSDVISSTDDVLPVIRSFFDLGETLVVNHDGHTRALLTVQVTELVDGVFIGFTMNHAVADGTTLWHFINTLSEIFNSDCKENMIPLISNVPIFRPLGQPIKLPYVHSNEFITRLNLDLGTKERIFHFTGEKMEILKAKANEDCRLGNYKISYFQSLCALLWRCVTRARKLPPHEMTTCSLVVNTRTRLDPPLTSGHFGNYRLRAVGKAEVGELLENGLGWAAMKLNQVVAAQDEEAAQRSLKRYLEAPFVARADWASSFRGASSITIGGSTRFDMYVPEFGLGRALAVRTGYGNKADGTVTANPGREGGGSVDLEVCFRTETMIALEIDEEFVKFCSL